MKGIKQGINLLMAIEVDTDLNEVDKIYFTFEQGTTSKTWVYPSDRAVRDGDTNIVNLKWDWTETYDFSTESYISMDSYIFVKGSDINPPTEKQSFMMATTLFTREQIEEMRA